MSVSNSPMRNYLIAAVVLVALALTGLFVYLHFHPAGQPTAQQDDRPTEKEFKGVKFKRPEDAKLRGIEAQGVRSVSWRPQFHVDGRVVPNPAATLEIRAPFAGVVRIEGSGSKLRLGAAIEPRDVLAMFDARFTPTEGLDLQTKLVEADARQKSAEEVLKIRQERLARLDKLPVGLLSQDDVDSATVQLLEARMQANVAHTQWKIWKQALESIGKKTLIVPLQSPIAGEVAEIGVQPGATVDAGQVIARIVDFKRVLLRLEFPTSSATDRPATSVQVEALDAPARWRAQLRGRATSLETALQKASWFYEIMPDERGNSPRWQAGLYVRAVLEDTTKPALPAIAVPSSALLVHQGRTLVYIEKRLGRYERREVDVLARDGATTYVAAEGWLAKVDRVVTQGAQVLLSEEFRSDVDND
jgi:hypothetical protein